MDVHTQVLVQSLYLVLSLAAESPGILTLVPEQM